MHPLTYKYPQKLKEILEKILPLREIIAREHMNPHGADRVRDILFTSNLLLIVSYAGDDPQCLQFINHVWGVA